MFQMSRESFRLCTFIDVLLIGWLANLFILLIIYLQEYDKEITAYKKSELNENEIITQLRNTGGANYDRQAHDY